MNLKTIWQDPLDRFYSLKALCAHRVHIHARVRFELKISVFERSKTVRASDYVTTILHLTYVQILPSVFCSKKTSICVLSLG
jgi:hypothetical protein